MAAGIYCIENDWWEDPKRQSTVEPILQMFRAHSKVDYIRRDVATDIELEFYLRQWSGSKYSKYPILYLALHGHTGELQVKEKKKVRYDSRSLTLDELEKILEGKCQGKVIMFSSCSTLGIHGNRLNTFVRKTKAKAVLGYKEKVDWLESLIFELALFSEITKRKKFHARSLRNGVGRVKSLHKGLAKKLKFRFFRSKT